MYLIINNNRYTISKRVVTKESIKYFTVTPAVEDISGTATMYRDDGFLMSEDNLDDFKRKSYVGTVLTVTNLPEPTPVDPTATINYRVYEIESTLNTLLGVATDE